MPEAGSGEAKYTLRMPDSLRDRLAERAKANNQSLNAWIVRCLESVPQSLPLKQMAQPGQTFRPWETWLAAIGPVGRRSEPSMSTPHDFEFQLGRNRALKGRGWRGLLALGLFLATCMIITTGSQLIMSPIKATVAYFSNDAR